MKSALWWYNLDWKQRCAYRELLHCDTASPEQIDILWLQFGKE